MNPPTLVTDRLLLIPCAAAHIEAFMQSPDALSAMIGYTVPDSWPVFPEGLPWWLDELRTDASMIGWANWIFVLREEKIVVGDGGLKGRPDGHGEVEIGYAIVPEYRKRGIATEAVGALIEWTFSHAEVATVRAHTLADGLESMSVLKKQGMEYVSQHHDPENGEIVLWRLSRENHRSLQRSTFHIPQTLS